MDELSAVSCLLSSVTCHLLLRDYGEGGHGALLPGFGDDGVEMVEDFRDGHGVDFAAGVVAFFDELLEVAAGDLGSELVGDDLAGALFLLDPGGGGPRDPHGASVDVEADIDGVCVACGDGDDGTLPAAVQVLGGPAVGYVEIFVHEDRVSFLVTDGKVERPPVFGFKVPGAGLGVPVPRA